MIVVCIPLGIYAIMWGTLLASFASFWITSFYTEKYLNYSVKELFSDIGGSIILSVGMAFVVVILSKVKMPSFLSLILQILVGIVFYIGASAVLHLESYEYLMGMVRPILRKILKKC